MTKAEFNKELGAKWRKILPAVLEVADNESPARKLITKSENDRLHGAVVYLNETVGWEMFRAFLVALADAPDEVFEPEDKFDTPEI